MPTYKVKCKTCSKVFEVYTRIAECGNIKCECGGDTNIIPSPSSVHIFKEEWYEHIDENPIFIKSKKQLKEECEKRGMIAKALD